MTVKTASGMTLISRCFGSNFQKNAEVPMNRILARAVLAVSAMLGASGGASFGDQYTWQAQSGDGDFNTAANWYGPMFQNNVPGSQDEAVFYNIGDIYSYTVS